MVFPVIIRLIQDCHRFFRHTLSVVLDFYPEHTVFQLSGYYQERFFFAAMQPVSDAVFHKGLQKQLMHGAFCGFGGEAAENLDFLSQLLLLEAGVLFQPGDLFSQCGDTACIFDGITEDISQIPNHFTDFIFLSGNRFQLMVSRVL